jgi:hypothetical protein
VAELFTGITPGTARRRPSSRFDALLSALPDPAATALEAERAFGSAEMAEHLTALARRPDGLLGELTRDRFANLGRDLLEELAASPDPEQATRMMRAFFARFAAPGPYVAALAAGEHALARFVTVLGSSSFVGEALVARMNENGLGGGHPLGMLAQAAYTDANGASAHAWAQMASHKMTPSVFASAVSSMYGGASGVLQSLLGAVLGRPA